MMIPGISNNKDNPRISDAEFDKLKKIREYKKNKENEISELQNEVSEIKSLLKQLLEKS